MNQTRRCVPVAHLGRDLSLVRDQKRASERRVIPKSLIDGPSSPRPNAGEKIGLRMEGLRMRDRKLGGRGRYRDDCSTCDDKRQTSQRPAARSERNEERDRRACNCDPGEAPETDK